MEGAYDWSVFTVHTCYRAPLERVWEAWSTSRGLESFFIGTSEARGPDGTPRSGDEPFREGDAYHWTFLHPFELRGAILSVEPRERVAFTFGPMETTVELRDLRDREHPERNDAVSIGWNGGR